MGVKGRRRIYKSGGSKVMTLFRDLATGKEATVAANRLLIADPSGEIPEDELHDFLEKEVEPLLQLRLFRRARQSESMQPPLL